MLRFFAIKLIKCYQYFISPHKGYKCAHNALHKQGGCSSRVLQHIKNKPMTKWYSSYVQELSACRHAFNTIQKNKDKDKKG
jgi:putative component of membrane protein insertase Oxa1/YidC/SpoIIIJ protein YidD